MLWLIIVVLAYFLFAVVALGDKYLLAGPPNPKTYVFYVGVLGSLSLILIPFINFYLPPYYQILISFLAGAVFIFALLGLYEGLEHFEASRIIPAIGGLLPLFIFVLTYLFSRGEETLNFKGFSAFVFLVLGSIFITKSPYKKISFKSFKISLITAFLFAIFLVLSKYVYLSQPFWNGFIWIRIGAAVTALFFIFTKDARKEIFERKFSFSKKTGILFISNQTLGVGAFILQHWAIALAGLAYLAIIGALQGVQYVFLFILTILLSLKFPKILKEEISKKILFQKIVSILLIGLGLVILAL